VSDLTNKLNRAKTRVVGLKFQVTEAEREVDRLQRLQDEELELQYKEGTVARLRVGINNAPIAIKVRSVHDTAGPRGIDPTDRPGWITIHGDSSGGWYPDLASVRDAYPSAHVISEP
jgi:hypothetical protein